MGRVEGREGHHPHPRQFNWLFPGWVLYFAGSLGYVVLDALAAANAPLSDFDWFVGYAHVPLRLAPAHVPR